jgi:hypothetical protein
VHEREGAPVGLSGLVDAVEPAEELGAGRVQVVVVVELTDVPTCCGFCAAAVGVVKG